MLRSPSQGRRGSAFAGLAGLLLTLVPAVALATSSPAGAAPSGSDLWSASQARPQAKLSGHTRRVNPSDYSSYTLDAVGLERILEAAPHEAARAAAPVTLDLPSPTGDLVRFEIVDSPVMEAGLAAAHPEISTYAGHSVGDGPNATVRLDVTPMGFHAYVRQPGDQGAWFIDPAYNGDDSLYLSYFGADLPDPGPLNEPASLLKKDARMAKVLRQAKAAQAQRAPGDVVSLRTYRLALLTDPSYAKYFGTANVLAEKVTLINRVNEVYNDDLAVRLVLVNDSDRLNFDSDAKTYGVNGPCGGAACFTTAQISGGCASSLLTRTRLVIGQVIGARNYDIGHIGLGINGGGIASLGVVGGGNKAQGCTGLPTPVGDFYAVDYVAHEIGHQFSGNHTFNGNQYNCSGGNRSAANSVEPGSGTSVMAYAGICQQDNLQPHSDPYFSQRSQTEITTYITSSRPVVNEVQNVGLAGFNTDGQSFTLTVDGQTTAPIVRGTNYTSAGIDAAIEAALGTTNAVTVAGFFNGTFGDSGFQVTFGGTPYAGLPVAPITVNASSGVSAVVGETALGGPQANGGSTVTPTANHSPVVTAPASKTIPLRTPFTLTGSAVDADNDPLVYLWEQNDRGNAATALVNQTKLNGPLFRVFGAYASVSSTDTLQIHSPGQNLATGSPSRTFPDLAQILANNTNAETGQCPTAPAVPATGGATNVPTSTVECFAEFLPTADYAGFSGANNAEPSLNMRLTARDQNPTAGGTSYADTKVLIDKTAGPFLVTSRNADTAAPAVAGTTETVTWSVAGTDKESLALNVKISLSTDGGLTYPTVLAASTPNDGAEEITWPAVTTDRARLKIEAVDNYFFDLNNADFKIGQTGGALTGTIKNASGTALPNACVYLYAGESASGATYSTCANPDGTYYLGGLVTGSYTVRVTDPSGAYDPASTSVSIGTGTTSLPLTLSPLSKGSLTGTVTNGTAGLANVCVFLYPSGTSAGASHATCTGADGTYGLYGVAHGQYDVAFYDPSGTYPTQWFTGTPGGAATQAGASAVTVSATPRTGVDAVLAASAVGAVRGTVTYGGSGTGGMCLYLYATETGPASYASCTADNGTYYIPNVAPGAYKMAVSDPAGVMTTLWWTTNGAGTATYANGATLTVNAGAPTTANQSLTKVATGNVAGAVTGTGNAPVGGACVFLYTPGATASASFASCSQSDGTYFVPAVTAGPYQVAFFDPSAVYATQWWTGANGGASTQSGAVAVTVTNGGATRSGVNAQLVPVS